MNNNKRVLSDVSDYELVNVRIKDLSAKYFVHSSTVSNELRLRGLVNNHVKQSGVINISREEVFERNITDLAKRERVGTYTLWKYIWEEFGVTKEDINQHRKELREENRNLDHITDDELRKSHKYLVKTYGTHQLTVQRERKKRGIVVTSSSERANKQVKGLSTEDLFGKTLTTLAQECGVSMNTISIERRKRRSDENS